MPKILNIETATDICSVSISEDLHPINTQRAEKVYQHAAIITQLIDACTKAAGVPLKELDALAVSTGPGSYTALRVGASTAKGIGYALDKPLIAVDTLKSLAYAARVAHPAGDCFIPMIDARRMEVYAKVFDQQLQVISDLDNFILEEETFKDYFQQYRHVVFAGNGAPKSEALFSGRGVQFSEIVCDAEHLIPLSYQAYLEQDFVDLAYYAPLYFKAPNITKSKKTL